MNPTPKRKLAGQPLFQLKLRDKGQSGRDFVQILKDKSGWVWRRVDPSGMETGFTRGFLEPKEILHDIESNSTMDTDAKKAIEFFQNLVDQESSAKIASLNVWKEVKKARMSGFLNPILGYNLERIAIAVVNPGARKFEQNLENTITVLESLKNELDEALSKLDTEDAKEFAKFFEDATEAEEEELRQVLKKVSTVAGVKDFFNKFKEVFKSKKPKADEVNANEPSYTMDDSTIDEFVEGKREWTDSGHYIEQEAKQNAEFFGGVEEVLGKMDSARKKPNRKLIQDILKAVDVLIRKGKNLSKGIREHLLEPGVTVDTGEGKKEKKPTENPKMAPEKLDSMVTYYADLLKDSSGDEVKTIKYLKELFKAVEPLIKENRAELASTRMRAAASIIRCAHARPVLRKHLLSTIYTLSGR